MFTNISRENGVMQQERFKRNPRIKSFVLRQRFKTTHQACKIAYSFSESSVVLQQPKGWWDLLSDKHNMLCLNLKVWTTILSYHVLIYASVAQLWLP